VIGSAIKSIPIAGRDITFFVQQMIRERESGFPSEESLEFAKHVKENYCYVCPDIVKEFRKYDVEPDKHFKHFSGSLPSSEKASLFIYFFLLLTKWLF
jgi:actin-related protein 3